MKLLVNHHGHLELDLGLVWVQSNPLRSGIMINIGKYYLRALIWQIDLFYDASICFFNVDWQQRPKIGVSVRYPLTAYNELPFVMVEFYRG